MYNIPVPKAPPPPWASNSLQDNISMTDSLMTGLPVPQPSRILSALAGMTQLSMRKERSSRPPVDDNAEHHA